MKTKWVRWSVLVCSLIIAGCDAYQSGDSEQETKPLTAEQLPALEGSEWQLQKMIVDNEAVTLVRDSQITIQFTAEGRVTGDASVNHYFGQISLDDKGNITWPEPGFGSTMMAGPPELMAQEQAYLNALKKTERLYVNDLDLTIKNQENSVVLEFQKHTAL